MILFSRISSFLLLFFDLHVFLLFQEFSLFLVLHIYFCSLYIFLKYQYLIFDSLLYIYLFDVLCDNNTLNDLFFMICIIVLCVFIFVFFYELKFICYFCVNMAMAFFNISFSIFKSLISFFIFLFLYYLLFRHLLSVFFHTAQSIYIILHFLCHIHVQFLPLLLFCSHKALLSSF